MRLQNVTFGIFGIPPQAASRTRLSQWCAYSDLQAPRRSYSVQRSEGRREEAAKRVDTANTTCQAAIYMIYINMYRYEVIISDCGMCLIVSLSTSLKGYVRKSSDDVCGLDWLTRTAGPESPTSAERPDNHLCVS